MRLRLPYWRQSHQEQHFQPPAGNEVLKEFQHNLTPMASYPPYGLGGQDAHPTRVN
ncbi:MAG: hypothetical protein V7K76_03510 [Nostoc sp.]